MVLSESGLEGGWLPDQQGVLGLDDDTVVTTFTLMEDNFWNQGIKPNNEEGKLVQTIPVDNPKQVAHK